MNLIKKILNNPIDSILYAITRLKLRLLIPDKLYIKFLWWLHYGKSLNLKNPQTFTEKIQWLKLYDRNPIYTQMVDKYAVKQIVSGMIGAKYIIPTLGIWDNPEDIDWESLPQKFALKTTHGGGSQGVLICRNKNSFDKRRAIKCLKKAMKQNAYNKLGEWPYKNIRKRIIAEKLIELPDCTDLTDYKFYCFNGKPRYIQVIQNRHIEETIDFYDIEWNHQIFYGLNPIPKPADTPIPKPQNLSTMLKLAEKLSNGINFARIDLYHTESEVYFGEITFYPASGFGEFTPKEYDKILGDMIHLDNASTNTTR